MEELHFANMVQYEANLVRQKNDEQSNSVNASFTDLGSKIPVPRKASLPNNRLMKTINPDEDQRHQSHSIQLLAAKDNFMTMDQDRTAEGHYS